MIILVTGSRDWTDYPTVLEALAQYEGGPEITVRHGNCKKGLDALAKRALTELGYEEDAMDADWDRFKKAAGYMRNTEMCKKEPKANICLAFGMPCSLYGGKCTVVPGKHVSHGTRHCAGEAKRFGIEVVRYRG